MKINLTKMLSDKNILKAELARRLGVNKSQITRWEQIGIPAERAVQIERKTGIPRAKLRPDLYV